jgi:ABC-type dipeptide/oligopeptide/nickel transport system ATPase subunit
MSAQRADIALSVEHVSHHYGRRRHRRTVLHDINFELERGKTLAVVGESGAGKSTLARIVAGLEAPAKGAIRVGGRAPRIRPGVVSPVQMIFQNPADALNRFINVGGSIAEPLRGMARAERTGRVRALLEQVGINPARAREKPSRFSGGQLQRIVTARALAAQPELLLCDEATSSLDVSVQAQIVNLLLELQDQRRFACLLVTHDLGVAKVLSDYVLVLRDGRVVEYSSAERFFSEPGESYSRELLATTADQMLQYSVRSAAPAPT